MSVQSIERVFDIIELLSTERDGVALTEIGRQLGLHKSTVHRLITVLRDRGYIEKNDSTGCYRLGPQFVELTSVYLNDVEIKTEAEPYLKALSQLVNRTVFMAVRHGAEVVYIDKSEQFNSLRKYSIIGRRKPIYCTSLGKALLLDHSDDQIDELLADIVFHKSTPNTIVDLDRFRQHMQQLREQGWAVDDEEDDVGIRCVGAPIRDYRGSIIAAISMSWNRAQEDPPVESVAPYVVHAAQKISHRIGYLSKTPTGPADSFSVPLDIQGVS